MIAVIFEVWPKAEYRDDYLRTAAELRKLLESMDGFISVERFESITETGKLLSLSFFESEEAVINWRNTQAHRNAQSLGRNRYFANYRLRISSVIRDYSMSDRDQVPHDSKDAHG